MIWPGTPGRDRFIAAARNQGMGQASRVVTAAFAVGALVLTSCSEETATDEMAPDQATNGEISRSGVSVELPDGWSEVEMPSAMGRPGPLFTVASAPVEVNRRPRVCHSPDRVLERLPADGAVVRVYDWAPKGLPARPATIKLDRVSYGSYECSGRSHSLAFHENGRGIDINVWFVQGQADPTVRHQAVELLNSLEVRDFPSRECHRDLGVAGDRGFRGADGLSCGEAALLWNEWIVPPEKLMPCPNAGATHDLRVTDGITCGIAERFILGGTRGFAPHPGGWIERKER
ncbi:MAG TPA: hypothetical protein VFH44_11520, partial [Solirubrobacterales bacterium]|nr:hypothetical protein [Solirubrobacterales bacterium]